MKINKKIVYIIIIALFIISGFLISKKMIKNIKMGNNISSQEIVDYILKTNSYKANVNVQVNSNKNTNKYVLEQEYNKENGSTQVVIEPSNIAGVKIMLKDGNLKIENTNLKLSKIFENYKGLEENSLDLISFIEDYKMALSMDEPYIFFEDVQDGAGNPRQFQTTKLKYTDTTGRLCTLGMCQDVTDMVRIQRENATTKEAYEKYAKNELPQKLKHRKLTFKGISRINN